MKSIYKQAKEHLEQSQIDLFFKAIEMHIRTEKRSIFNDLRNEYVLGKASTDFVQRLQTFLNIALETNVLEKLTIFVLTSTQSDWVGKPEPVATYHDTPEDWTPYQTQGIKTLLDDFKGKSKIDIQPLYFSPQSPLDDVRKFVKNSQEKRAIILIADAFSLQFEVIKEVVQCFDCTNKDDIGGILFPLDGRLPDAQKQEAQMLLQTVLKDITKEWYELFSKSYTHIELQVHDETQFFRRLANIAFYRGISETEAKITLEILNPQLKNTLDKNNFSSNY